MSLKFRYLNADEVECRVAMIKDSGLSLLLYKDARVDQNLLDKTVGPMNWQKHYSRDNANCTVSIWDAEKGQWIEKEDTGKESFTEAEKGLASDSFKRACFCWGIGRELYTAPFIWIDSTKANISRNNAGKPVCYDSFKVKKMSVEDGTITALDIVKVDKQKHTEQLVYQMKPNRPEAMQNPIVQEKMNNITVNEKEISMIKSELARTGIGMKGLLQNYELKSIEDMNLKEFADAMEKLKSKPAKKEAV